MSATAIYRLLGPALFSTIVAAHGHISNVVINGVSYAGWDIGSFPYMSSPPTVIAWGTPNTSNGFITPDEYGDSDIICHQDATNAKGHAVVAAGDQVFLQWTPEWPSSHHGPVVTYLANCGTSCETVDKTKLEFFKIDGVGLIDDSTPPGTWADDELIAQGSGWMVKIPPSIAPGNYVMRHELIALHSAGSAGGAQNYPQCFNLQITGSGTDKPAGVLGTSLYKSTDPGILIDIYQSLSTYIVPGPTLYSGAVSIKQTTSAITASGTPATGTGGGAAPITSTSKSTSTTTTLITVPTTKTTTTAAPGGATQTVYGQCGGIGWTAPTACVSGAACSSVNPYYFQCLPTGV
ncbi:hypothetical protein N7535_001772 [Penicillium sp. DV-2018c]|nr:hypothetical protein N7461_004984 [Penicillium sp. DV-2018c]KAJ5583152.1 hypothetical protein N7535_001772 [Penicillium sp. DV-2018c]